MPFIATWLFNCLCVRITYVLLLLLLLLVEDDCFQSRRRRTVTIWCQNLLASFGTSLQNIGYVIYCSVCVCARVWVCVLVRVYVCECVCVCVWERERVCVWVRVQSYGFLWSESSMTEVMVSKEKANQKIFVFNFWKIKIRKHNYFLNIFELNFHLIFFISHSIIIILNLKTDFFRSKFSFVSET